MKLESDGILISIKPFNERDSLARIFTHEYGVLVGMIRGAAVAKKNIPMPGQIGCATWNARLDSQLGVFHWANERNIAAQIMMHPERLSYMNAAFDLLANLLPEREGYPHLYTQTITMLEHLTQDDGRAPYMEWEIVLLRELGYALDLTHCSGCGGTESLTHLSPRTGRAVCATCAQPYINKLYKLPLNLSTTFAFLERLCTQQEIPVPLMRKLLK